MKHTLGGITAFLVIGFTLVFVTLNTTACNATPVSETDSETNVEAETEAEADTEAETETEAEVADKAEPTVPPTVSGRTLVNLNLRQGPGTNYSVVNSLPADTEFTAIGRNDDSSWIVVEHEADEVWMSGLSDYVDINSEAVTALPIVEISASTSSSAINNPAVLQLVNEIPLVVHHGTHQTCASHGGLNNLFDVANGNLIGPHSGDFVFDNNNVLFEYSGGSLLLIRESPQATFADGEKYLPYNQALDLFASGRIVWTGSIGEWPARGVTGCDPAAHP